METGPRQRWSPDLSNRDADEYFKQSRCGVVDGQDDDKNFDSPPERCDCPKDTRKKQENGQFCCEYGYTIQDLDIVIDLPSRVWSIMKTGRMKKDITRLHS